jgi:hypothetical protein
MSEQVRSSPGSSKTSSSWPASTQVSSRSSYERRSSPG